MKQKFKGKNFSAVFTDENGYYSLTGDIEGGSGALGDKLVEIDKGFVHLLNLHLCEVGTGRPMHAWANAEHHVKNNAPVSSIAGSLHVSEKLAREFAELWRVHNYRKRTAKGGSALIPERFRDNREFDALKEAAENLADTMEEIEDVWADAVANLADALEDLSDYFPENRPGFVEPLDEEGNVLPAYSELCADELDRMTALARHLGAHISGIMGDAFDNTMFTAEGSSYLVVTDEEANFIYRQ